MGYPDQALGMRLECAPDADLTADPDTYTWQEITSDLYMPKPIVHKRGAEDEQTEGISETAFALKNPTGRYTTDNPYSDLWPKFGLNLPVRFSTNTGDGSGWHQEWVQYVSEAKDAWPAATPNLCISDVTCAGLFRRMGRWSQLGSALRRSISGVAPGDYVPHEHWTGEDGENAAWFGSANGGAPATYFGTVNFASDTDLTGSEPLPTLESGAVITAPVRAYDATDRWIFQWFVKIDVKPASMKTIFEASTTGSATTFRIVVDPLATAVVRLYLLDAAGATLGASEIELNGSDAAHPSEADFFGHWATIMTASSQDSPVDPLLGWLGLSVTPEMPSSGGVMTGGTHGAITQARLYAGEGCSVGHWAVWTDPAFDPVSDASVNAAAMFGYVGEMAADRIARLCREARLPYNVTATSSTPMGVQLNDTLLANLRDCEATDHGILDDSQGVVEYRALSEICNQDSVMVIDAAYRNELFMPFDPVTDDQKRRNVVTARRPNGSEATVANRADIDGVAGVRRGVGEYPADLPVNVDTDAALANHASWVAHNTGVWPGKRYPAITFDLRRAPHLIAAARNLRVGDRIQVINPPRQHSRAAIDVIFPGWSVVNAGRRGMWRYVANALPYLYHVGVYDAHDTRYDSDSTTLTAELSPTATTFAATVEAGAKGWIQTSTHPTEFPLNLFIGGLVYECTGITGTTFTIRRLSRDKLHLAGTPVHVYDPGVYGLT